MKSSSSSARTHFTDVFYRRPQLLLWGLLALPLLWMVVIYIGSLLNMLSFSFYSIDDFTGQTQEVFTLGTLQQLVSPANIDIVLRTLYMAIAGMSNPRTSSHSERHVRYPKGDER